MKSFALLSGMPWPCLVVVAFSAVSAPLLRADILVADGTTYEVTSTTTASDDFDVDPDSSPGGGDLHITGGGNLIFGTGRRINNTWQEGTVTVDGRLTQNAPSPGEVRAAVAVHGGGWLQSFQSSLYLTGGAVVSSGAKLNADGGDIYFSSNRPQSLGNVSLAGTGYLRAFSGDLLVLGPVNSTSGAAGGGFAIQGGNVKGFPGLGGAGAGTLSADHGILGYGTLDGAALRFTGNVTKSGGYTLDVASGSIRNEGTLTQEAGGKIDTDSSAAASGGGTLVNAGTWDLYGDSEILNSHDRGVFNNEGLFRQHDAAGVSYVHAKFNNAAGATVRADAGSFLALQNGGSYGPGTVFDAGGRLALGPGNHLISSASLTGQGWLDAFTGDSAVSITGAVGPESGPATGGFQITGGAVAGLAVGTGVPSLSAERGNLGWGGIRGLAVRFTGNSEKMPLCTLDIASGRLTNEGTMTQHEKGSFQLDPDNLPGIYGTLVNQGTWNLESDSGIRSLYGEGKFQNNGLLQQVTPGGFSVVEANFTNAGGATIRTAEGAAIILTKGGFYEENTRFDSNGSIGLAAGLHLVASSTLTGSGYLNLLGTMQLLGPIGPATGPATGGFQMGSGTLGPSAFSGAVDARVSADHGLLVSGTMNSVKLRITGETTKAGNFELGLQDATFVNEGHVLQKKLGNFDLHPVTGTGSNSVIDNKGSWDIEEGSIFKTTGGTGKITNGGLFQTLPDGGTSYINCFFINLPAATVRAGAGADLAMFGGTISETGSILDAAGGNILLSGGLNLLKGPAITGGGNVRAISGSTYVTQRVGPETGAATGGLDLVGGTLSGAFDNPLGVPVSGPGAGSIAVDHGSLYGGTIDGATVRYTGASRRSGPGSMTIRSGGLINDGTLMQDATGDFQLDPDQAAGVYGSLWNRGTWTAMVNGVYSSTYGEGAFLNSGLFAQTDGSAIFNIQLENRAGGTLSASTGDIYMRGGDLHEPGSILLANTGSIYLQTGQHLFNGGSLTGAGYLRAGSGGMNVLGNVGAPTGSATGGFSLEGGSLTGSATLSADHGLLGGGSMDGTVTLRFTGSAVKQPNTHLTMNGGTIRNEGTMSTGAQANFDLDAGDSGGAGLLINAGQWNLNGNSSYSNTYGSGIFRNSGEINQGPGTTIFSAAFDNQNGGSLRNHGGAIYLNGGGLHQGGSLLDADGGPIYVNAGTHNFAGGELAGDNYVYASGGSMVLSGDIGPTSGNADGGFGIVGGNVSGSGMISADHGYFSSGSIQGNVVLRLTGEFKKEDNSHLQMNGGTIRNDGTYVQSTGGNFDLDSGDGGLAGTIINNGTWRINNSSSYANTYGGGVFRNNGLLLSQAGASIISAGFQNGPGGILRVAGGYILLNGGGTQAAGSTLEANGGDIYLNGGSFSLSGGNLTGSSYVYASGGATVAVSGAVGPATGAATGGFGISGGNVTGSGTLSAARGSLGGGSLSGDVTLRFTSTITKADNSQLQISGGTIRSEGTFSSTSNGNFDLDTSDTPGGGTLSNKGTWQLEAGATYYNTYGGGRFVNDGLFLSQAGATNIYAPFSHQAGSTFRVSEGQVYLRSGGSIAAGATLDANGGDLYFIGGTHSFFGGILTGNSWVWAADGSVKLLADVGSSNGPASGGFGVSGGNVGGTEMISTQRGYLASGSISDGARLRFANTATKSANSQIQISNGTILNDGTLVNESNGSFELDSSAEPGGGTLVNNNIWRLESGTTYYNTYGGGKVVNKSCFENVDGSTNIYAPFDQRAGSVVRVGAGQLLLRGGGSVGPGVTLDANGGDLYLLGGTQEVSGGTITGSSWVFAGGGDLHLSGNLGAATGPATGGFGIYSTVTLGGSGMISSDRGYLESGLITGDVTVRFTGDSTKTANSQLRMTDGTIRNEGTLVNQSNGSFELDASDSPGGGMLENNNVWRLDSGTTYYNTYNGGRIINRGLFLSQAGNSNLNPPFRQTAGSVLRVTAGQVCLRGGGTLVPGSTIDADGGDVYLLAGREDFSGGTITGGSWVYDGGGVTEVSGTVGASSGPATGGFGLYSEGVLAGSGIISTERGYLAGGTLTGDVTLRYTGDVSKDANSQVRMDGGTIRNEGSLLNASNGSFDLDTGFEGGAGTLVNKGIWEITAGTTYYNTYGAGSFRNEGTLKVTAGTTGMYELVTNTGTIAVKDSSLYLYGNGDHTGSILSNSGYVYFGGNQSLHGAGGLVGGGGAVGGSLSIFDGARLSPGSPAATLALYGAVNFVTGGTLSPVVAIDLDPEAGGERISVAETGSLNLGTGLTQLDLQLVHPPERGHLFRFLSCQGNGRFTGRFKNAPSDGDILNVDFSGETYHLRIAYDPAGKFIELDSLSNYQVWAAGLGLVGSDASLDADPDGDGVANGIEFVLGGEPRPGFPGSVSVGLLPTIAVDGNYLRFTYRRRQEAPSIARVEYGTDLIGWTATKAGANGVVVSQTADPDEPGFDKMVVLIPRPSGNNARLFTRLVAEE